MRLAVYSRTSTKNGAGSDSLGAQEQTCCEWAQANGHEVAAVFRDDGLSGALGVEQRPGLAAALLALENGDADGLIVHRLDRLARELHVQEAALAHAWKQGDHVQVFEAVEGIVKRDDPTDPHRRFLRQVLGAAAELERGIIRARLHGGRRRKAARGGYTGGPRLNGGKYGYQLVGGVYEPVEAEQAVLARIVAERASGATLRLIAEGLEADGVPSPTGGAWHLNTISRLANRVRIG